MSMAGTLKDKITDHERELETRRHVIMKKFFARGDCVYFGETEHLGEKKSVTSFGATLVALPGAEYAQAIADNLNRTLDPCRSRERMAAHEAINRFRSAVDQLADHVQLEGRRAINNAISCITVSTVADQSDPSNPADSVNIYAPSRMALMGGAVYVGDYAGNFAAKVEADAQNKAYGPDDKAQNKAYGPELGLGVAVQEGDARTQTP